MLTEPSEIPKSVPSTPKANVMPRYKMTVVLVSEFFAPGMGYLENSFPKYLARAGVETHVIATDLPLSYREKGERQTYKNFVQPLPAGKVEHFDGYTVHILGHQQLFGHMRIAGLGKKLASLRPDVVQTMTPIGWIANQVAWYKLRFGYKFFSGCHYHSSVFPLASRTNKASSSQKFHCLVTRTIPGRLASFASEKCHCISLDCADVATRFFGVPQKQIVISPLGVDTELFFPATHADEFAQRVSLRRNWDLPTGMLCAYIQDDLPMTRILCCWRTPWRNCVETENLIEASLLATARKATQFENAMDASRGISRPSANWARSIALPTSAFGQRRSRCLCWTLLPVACLSS